MKATRCLFFSGSLELPHSEETTSSSCCRDKSVFFNFTLIINPKSSSFGTLEWSRTSLHPLRSANPLEQPIRTAERKAPSITKHIWRRTKQNKTGDDLKIKLATNAKTCPVRRILVNLVNMTNWSFFSKQNIYSSSSFNIVVKLCQFSSHSSRTALGLLSWCRRVGGRFIHF